MSLAAALVRSTELAQETDADVHDLRVPATDRARLAGALLHQSFEHHHAVRLLLENKDTGSAFSLVRILFETTLRGIWLARCATENQVELFKQDRIDASFGGIVEAIENFFSQPGGVLTRIKRNYWEGMCSYAHGGYLQAVRRLTDEHITPNYAEDEQIEAIFFADFCLILASMEICALSGDDALVSRCGDRFAKLVVP